MAKLQTLLKDTVIYGLSSIVGRFLNYLLVPLYTYSMTAESGNYGIVTNVYSWVALLLALLTFGFETTFFKFANNSGANAQKVFSMSLQVIGALCALFLLAIFTNIDSIASALDYSDHPEFVTMMAVVVSLDAIQAILFGYIRYSKRPWKFACLKLLFITMSIAMNLVAFLLLPWLNKEHPHLVQGYYDPNNQAYYIPCCSSRVWENWTPQSVSTSSFISHPPPFILQLDGESCFLLSFIYFMVVVRLITYSPPHHLCSREC